MPGFFESLFGQTDLGAIRQDIERYRPEQIDVEGLLAGTGLQDLIDMLKERATLDQSGIFRQGMRQDIGAFNLAQRAQMRGDVAAAGISPILGAAAGRAQTASALGTMGQAVGQFRIGQSGQQLSALQSALGGATALGQIGLGGERANLMAGTQYGMFGAGTLTGARQQNVAARAQGAAGLLGMGAGLLGGGITAFAGLRGAGQIAGAMGQQQQFPQWFNPLGGQQTSTPSFYNPYMSGPGESL